MPEKSNKKRPAKIPRGDTVAEEISKAPGPFDVKTLEALIALMSQNDLSEIDLRAADQRITLRRGNATPLGTAVPVMPVPAGDPLALAAAQATPAKADATPAAPPAKKLMEIKSPTPGTFYGASSPDAQAFVRVGSKVTPTTVVCLIEAMKIFNEIPADCTGVIAEILVENQQPVEYGQVLFRVDPTA